MTTVWRRATLSRQSASEPLGDHGTFNPREAKARFTEAAAARGERVVVTKYGRPFVELVSAQKAIGMDFEKAAMIRRELGLDALKVTLPPDFDDPAFSRQVLGLER